MLQILLEFFGEFVLQALLQALVEFGLNSIPEPFRKHPNPWVAAVAYAIFGASVGALSLWPFPMNLVSSDTGRLMNVIATPIGVGLGMCILGRWRERRRQSTVRIDHFAYGYLFALAFALVRFGFGR